MLYESGDFGLGIWVKSGIIKFNVPVVNYETYKGRCLLFWSCNLIHITKSMYVIRCTCDYMINFLFFKYKARWYISSTCFHPGKQSELIIDSASIYILQSSSVS